MPAGTPTTLTFVPGHEILYCLQGTGSANPIVLHILWCLQENRARAEALLYFNSKRSAAKGHSDRDEGDYLDPILQELSTTIQSQLQSLEKQTSQLHDCLKVMAAFMTSCPLGSVQFL